MLVAQCAGPSGVRLSDHDISGNVLLLLLAGEDTTADTLSSILYHVAHSPEVQRRLGEENLEILGCTDGVPRHEDLSKLVYATAVAQETLRLRSAVPVIFLESARDATLGNVSIPSGTPIFLLTRFIALSNDNFVDAETFDPSRWIENEHRGPPHHPRASLAFGGGPRICPGRSLAMFQAATLLSMIARTFRLELVRGRNEVEERFDLTMRLEGVRVRFHTKSQS